ncbi:lytic polysaccharide monooxygenase [Aplosporella prunicola CBS 121167]|uniref:lytic cellulose monooxygenase (C4-dehydrogenating) n=1 Tax=Aplosporella prunicola CBS 121167 TaxID=1176127 RepID=A0A6A6BD67_9PEZI|nr:lytic polysaccharide monooxygenase [Aplosporella prunicola CBS 121167]KAF2140847.1 lytic polysaccharide monooxygenase [Aplosporella prunicola CBS 121167]
MKFSTSLALFAAGCASAHYTFPALIVNDQVTEDWKFVRMTKNHYSHGPVQDVTSQDIRCYEDPSASAETKEVKAGDSVGFKVDSNLGHPGALQFYMAKAPEGKTAKEFKGDGDVWFKISGQGPKINNGELSWPSDGASQINVTIPESTPNGEYLFRGEHIALHGAQEEGGAQFYIACAQIKVTGGGNGSPSPTVALPGAYKASDPGLKINIYYPVPTSYTLPGPKVWSG